MTFGPIEYDNPMYRARAMEKWKREQAADLITLGRKLALDFPADNEKTPER